MSDAPPEARVRVIVFETHSGRICHVNGNVPGSLVADQAGAGQTAMIAPPGTPRELAEFHIRDGRPRPRPTLVFNTLEIRADGRDEAVLDLPGPFRVLIDGVAHDLGDRLEITSDMPGTYRVVIEDAFPWLDLDVEIVAS